MKTIHHLCQGGTAAALLRAALSEPVIDILDDTAIGPLADVDTNSPHARVAFMKALFACGGFDAQDTDAMDWYEELRDMNRRLAGLATNASEVVIWAGSGETEQALRRRAHWWLRDADVAVSEVAMSPRESTDATQRAPVAADLRMQLANEWDALKKDGDALRVVENGALVSHPIDHYDATFVSMVSGTPAKLMSAEIIGRAMSTSRRSDLFCKWRFSNLIAQKKIAVTQGDLSDWNSVFVAT
jgi:hypothetical protein